MVRRKKIADQILDIRYSLWTTGEGTPAQELTLQYIWDILYDISLKIEEEWLETK